MATTFNPADLNRDIDQNTRNVMLDVILQWARYDALVSQWTIAAFGMPIDSGSILLGKMDARTKLERLKALYQHHGAKKLVASVRRLQKAHLSHVDVRNAIAHYTCAGSWKSDPKMIAFAPVKPFKENVGHMMVEHYHLDQMTAAAAFAKDAADKLMTMLDRLEELREQRASEPPQSPASPRPNPRKSARRKRPPPPPKRQA